MFYYIHFICSIFPSFSLCLTDLRFLLFFFILFFLFGRYTLYVCLSTVMLVKLQYDRKGHKSWVELNKFSQSEYEDRMVTDFFSFTQHQEQMSKFPAAPWGLSLMFFCFFNGREEFFLFCSFFFQKRPIRVEGIRKTTVFFFPQNFPLCFHAHFPWLSILCSSSQILQRTVQGA